MPRLVTGQVARSRRSPLNHPIAVVPFPNHRSFMRCFLGLVTLTAGCLSAGATQAQETPITHHAVADSADSARVAWGRGVRALRGRDLREARNGIRRAATAWPTQPVYLWGRAVTSAMTGDTADVIAALTAYAALGLGRDLRADTAIARFLVLPAMRRIEAQHRENLEPLVGSTVRATLADSTFWPEGVDHDARTGRLYVGSIRHKTIAEVTPQGTVRELWPRGQVGMGAILGVRVDAARGVVWATTTGLPLAAGYAAGDSTIAALVRVRIPDGVIERRWDLPPARQGHTLGDLAIGPSGDVFMTDSNEPVLYRLRPGADTLERLTHPLFRSLQGVAPAPDGRTVFVADYSHGLLHVELESGAVTRIEDALNTTSLGVDGIAWDRGAIVAVQNGVAPARIMRFVLDPSGRRMTSAQLLDRNSTVADEPTIGTIVDGSFVYVANSQWEKYDGKGARLTGTVLRAPVLLEVRLPD